MLGSAGTMTLLRPWTDPETGLTWTVQVVPEPRPLQRTYLRFSRRGEVRTVWSHADADLGAFTHEQLATLFRQAAAGMAGETG